MASPFFIVPISLLLTSLLFGQTDPYSNDALRTQHYDNLEKSTIYGSAPITHLNPSLNNISYALGLDFPNYTLTPDREDPNYTESSNLGSQLDISGWNVSPHLSISLKNIGLGFSVGRGERKAVYQYDVKSYALNVQESKLNYGDVGLFLYFVPFPKIKRGLRATMILGGRSINAKHAVSSVETIFPDGKINASIIKIYRYNVNELNLGLNLKFNLLKRFAIIPWADYRYVDTSIVEAMAKDEVSTQFGEILSSDIDLFWHDSPNVRYGIDFSVRIMRLEVNLGGLLGALALSGQGKESIKDDSISISVSFHQKGN